MTKKERIEEKYGQLGEACAEAGYRWELVEDAVNEIGYQKDEEAALNYILDHARRKVSSSEFFGAVVDLTFDAKTRRARFKFGDGGVAKLIQVCKPLDEENMQDARKE